MTRGVSITEGVEDIIADVYAKCPELRTKPKKFHEEVHRRVHQEISWAEPDWPGLSAVKKRLIVLRRNDQARSPESKELDTPWRLSSLSRHPIPSDALPAVMAAYQKRLEEGPVLSIREAVWMGRLYGAIEPKDLVYDWAFIYALSEQISEIIKRKPFDSALIDLQLMKNVYSARETQRDMARYRRSVKEERDEE